jgi:hypothetical protein
VRHIISRGAASVTLVDFAHHNDARRDGQFYCGTYMKRTLYNFMKELKNGL